MTEAEFEWISDNDICFVTGYIIDKRDNARWTGEFDAWISERGQQLIENAYKTGELENNREWQIVYAEWYSEDESRSSVMNELFINSEEDGDA